MVVSNLVPESTRAAPRHVTLAVVFQVRDDALQALMWQRAREPSRAVGRSRAATSSLGDARGLDPPPPRREGGCPRARASEQLETRSDPGRNPRQWELATAYLGLVPADLDPALPPDTAWHPVGALPPAAFDQQIKHAGRY